MIGFFVGILGPSNLAGCVILKLKLNLEIICSLSVHILKKFGVVSLAIWRVVEAYTNGLRSFRSW